MKKILLSMLCTSTSLFYAATLTIYNKSTMPIKATITYSDTSKTDTINPNDSSSFNTWFYDIKAVRWDGIWSVILDMPAGNTGGKFTIYNNGIFESTRKEELEKVYKKDGYLQAINEAALISARERDFALVTAARERNIAKVKELIAAGAIINPDPIVLIKDGKYHVSIETALNEAVKNEDKAMINLLLENGANPNMSLGEWSAISIGVDNYYEPKKIIGNATLTGDIELVKLLIENGAKPDFHTVYLALEKKFFSIAKYLIDKGAVNTNVPLNHAAYLGNKPFAEYLINTGANSNEKDYVGVAPLIITALYGEPAIAQLLLNKGAQVNIQDNDGNTVLITAIKERKSHRRPGIIELLIKYDANTNIQNNEGNTALIVAAMKSYGDIIKMLIDAGARLNIQNNEGNTALMIATINGRDDIVKMFIEHGADVTLKNKNGANASSFAVVKEYTDIAKMLEEAKAKQGGA